MNTKPMKWKRKRKKTQRSGARRGEYLTPRQARAVKARLLVPVLNARVARLQRASSSFETHA